MTFDWDDANLRHIARHKVSRQEAEQFFHNDPLFLEVQTVHGEERHIFLGETNAARILNVAMTWRGDAMRVVTAWDSAKASKIDYLRTKGSTI